MRLPHHLLRSYREYKEQERSLLLWIEKTAAASGHVLPQTGPKTVGVKLKGRARTLARRATATRKSNNGEEAPSPSTSPEEPTISILEILSPIEAIARNAKISSIPANIVEQFTAIQDLRKACLDWFKINTSQCDVETLRRNKRHAFPLKIIRDAIALLASKIPTQETTITGPTLSVKADPNTSKFVNNIFDHLSLEETEDTSPQSAFTESEHLSDSAINLFDSQLTKEEQMQDEFNIAKFCMLRDIQEIEDYMVLELVRYSLDQANADVLPFLCNFAIDIVAKMEASLYESFDRDKFEKGFLDTVLRPNWEVVTSSPILRMENSIRLCVQRKDEVPLAEELPETCDAFDPRTPYFGTLPAWQNSVKKNFFNHLLHLHSTRSVPDTSLSFELTPSLVSMLVPQLFKKNGTYPIPTSTVFAVRIALLAVLILNEQPCLPHAKLSCTSIRIKDLSAIREDLWKTPQYQSKRVKSIWHQMQPGEIDRRNLFASFAPSIGLSMFFLHAYPLMCALNDSQIRMFYAMKSIRAIEFSNIVKILAHLWNLLQEEKHLDFAWPDMQYLLEVLGEKFMFQSARPTCPTQNAVTLRSRLVYGMGLRKRSGFVVGEPWDLSSTPPVATFKPYFSSEFVPLFTLLSNRCGGLAGSLRAEDAELIVTAIVFSDIIGQRPQSVHFASDSRIANRDKLWNYRDQMPHLQPMDLLALVKKCLHQEFRILDFDYLKFEQSTLEFAENLALALGIMRIPSAPSATPDAIFQLENVAELVITTSQTSPMLPAMARAFEQWLETNSYVGVKALNIVEQRPIKPGSLLTSLKPEVLEHVKDIVKRRGLREDVFSRDQLDGSLIAVTGKIEDAMRAAWAEHKIQRKTKR